MGTVVYFPGIQVCTVLHLPNCQYSFVVECCACGYVECVVVCHVSSVTMSGIYNVNAYRLTYLPPMFGKV